MYKNTTKNNHFLSVVGATKSDDTKNEKLDFVNLSKGNSRNRADVVKLGEIFFIVTTVALISS